MLEVYWTRFIHVNSTFRCAFRLPVMRHRTSILNTPQISRSRALGFVARHHHCERCRANAPQRVPHLGAYSV